MFASYHWEYNAKLASYTELYCVIVRLRDINLALLSGNHTS